MGKQPRKAAETDHSRMRGDCRPEKHLSVQTGHGRDGEEEKKIVKKKKKKKKSPMKKTSLRRKRKTTARKSPKKMKMKMMINPPLGFVFLQKFSLRRRKRAVV